MIENQIVVLKIISKYFEANASYHEKKLAEAENSSFVS